MVSYYFFPKQLGREGRHNTWQRRRAKTEGHSYSYFRPFGLEDQKRETSMEKNQKHIQCHCFYCFGNKSGDYFFLKQLGSEGITRGRKDAYARARVTVFFLWH